MNRNFPVRSLWGYSAPPPVTPLAMATASWSTEDILKYSASTACTVAPVTVATEYTQSTPKDLRLAAATAVLCYMIPIRSLSQDLDVLLLVAIALYRHYTQGSLF